MNALQREWELFRLRLKYGLHPGKPTYPFRLISNILRTKWYRYTKQNKYILRGIDFAITWDCNFRCEHCYAETLKGTGNNKLMTPEQYREVCRQAMELGCMVFSLQGGEPFVREDVFDVIEAFNPKKNNVFLNTNGSLCDERVIKRLRDSGVDCLYFSIDSGIAEEHDHFRKYPGSYQTIVEAIDLCEKYGINVVVNTVVFKENLYSEGFKRVLDFCKSRRILHQTIFACPVGNWTGRVDLTLGPEDKEYFQELRKDYPNVVRDMDNNWGKFGCPAGKEVLYISAFGDVHGCPYNHTSLGNVLKEPLKDIWDRALQVKWYREYHPKCLMAEDVDFLKFYLPLADKKQMPSLDELIHAEKEAAENAE